jgi:hypothetical protein
VETARALETVLVDASTRPYHFAFTLSAQVMAPHHEPFLATSDTLSIEKVHAAVEHRYGQRIAGHDHMWPADLRWVMTTDYDLDSPYIASHADTATRILLYQQLEGLLVAADTPLHPAKSFDSRPDQASDVWTSPTSKPRAVSTP